MLGTIIVFTAISLFLITNTEINTEKLRKKENKIIKKLNGEKADIYCIQPNGRAWILYKGEWEVTDDIIIEDKKYGKTFNIKTCYLLRKESKK